MSPRPSDDTADQDPDASHRDQVRRALGQRIRTARVACGWTQHQLAFVAGMHPAYVGSVERGERNIGFDNLARIAEALGVSLAVLLRGV